MWNVYHSYIHWVSVSSSSSRISIAFSRLYNFQMQEMAIDRQIAKARALESGLRCQGSAKNPLSAATASEVHLE